MAKIIKNTDLTKIEGDPTGRSDLAIRRVKVSIRLALGKVSGEIKVHADARSPLGIGITVMLLALAGCVVAAVMTVVLGMPGWAACCGLLAPALVAYAGMRLLGSRHRPPPRRP